MSNTQRLGSIWRGRAWDDGEPIPRVTLPDNSLAEAMAALTYGWDGSAFQKLKVDGSGNLLVAVTGAGSGGTSSADGAAWVAGTTAGTPVMGARDDAASSTLAEDKVGVIRATTNRALHVNLRDSSGNELSTSGGTQYTEDAASAADPVGGMLISRRRDTLSSSEVSTDGDNIALNSTAKGELYVKHVDTVPATQSGTWNVGTVTSVTNVVHVDDNAGSLTVDGTVTATLAANVTEDAGSAGGETSVLIAGVRNDSAAAKTSNDGDFGNIALDSAGRVGIADLGGSISVDDNSGSITVDQATGSNLHTVLDSGTLTTITNVVHVDDNSGSLTVDSAQLPSTLGQKTMANSLGVAIASDQTAVPASQSGTWNIGTVTTLTGITNVVHVDDNSGSLTVDSPGVPTALGQSTMANSMRVVLASDQSSIPVTQSGTWTVQQGGAPWSVTDTADTADGATSKPSTRLISGWDPDYSVLRAAHVKAKNGFNQLQVHDHQLRVAVSSVEGAIRDLAEQTSEPESRTEVQTFSLICANSTNQTSVRTGQGRLHGWYLFNGSASTRYVKLYDKQLPPVAGTDAPKLRIAVPAGAAANLMNEDGIDFFQGIGLAITTGIADTDTTAPSANDVIVNLFYR